MSISDGVPTLELLQDDMSDSSGDFMSPMSGWDVVVEEVVEPPISEQERVLIAPVQDILDGMNEISTLLNQLEGDLHGFDGQRRDIAKKWTVAKEEMCIEIGLSSIEKVRPLMDLYNERQLLQTAVNEATREYIEAGREYDELKQQEWSPNMIEKLQTIESKKDTFERLSVEKTVEFNAVQTLFSTLKTQLGARVVDRAWPYYEAFLASKQASESLTRAIAETRSKMKKLKDEYRQSLLLLESISTQVHQVRQTAQKNTY